MLDLIASVLVKGLNRFFHVMPMRFNLWLGRRFGVLVCFLSGKRRKIAYANLKASFCGEKLPEELRKLTKNVYINMAQTFVELVSMTKADKKYVKKYISVRNIERLEEWAKSEKSSKGLIFLSAHFGNWEFSALAGNLKGYPLYFLGREQKMKRLNELLNVIRESKGNIVIRKGKDIKKIFRILRDGKIVGMAGDQNAGANGELIDLFGRPASTAIGPFRIAERTGAAILPVFIHRVGGPYHEFMLEPIMFINSGEDIIPYMREYNRLLEKHVRGHPEQWLWMHKRWKATPLKQILILDDGKKGHLKQSLAVVEQIKKYRKEEGYLPEHLKIKTVNIEFKSAFAKTIFNILNLFIFPGSVLALRSLKTFLTEQSYDKAVNKSYADVIVSCASSLFAVNSILKAENNARNVTVLDPGYILRKRFSLIIVPRHDVKDKKLEALDNVMVTDLAPNLVEPSSHVAGLSSQKSGVSIGVLIGGDNSCFTFGDGLARSLGENLQKACMDHQGNISITTSRRTSGESEAVLKDIFKGDPRCTKFISGNQDQDEDTVEKILAASDVVVVSGESISMVSEAVSSGKPVLVFMLEKKTDRVTKYENFTEGLENKKYLVRIKPEEISEEIGRVINNKSSFTVADDNNRILEKMYKLF